MCTLRGGHVSVRRQPMCLFESRAPHAGEPPAAFKEKEESPQRVAQLVRAVLCRPGGLVESGAGLLSE
jgi:hypothetical protein